MARMQHCGNVFTLSSDTQSRHQLPPTQLGGVPVGQPKRGGNSWTRFRQENRGEDMPEVRRKYRESKVSKTSQGKTNRNNK